MSATPLQALKRLHLGAGSEARHVLCALLLPVAAVATLFLTYEIVERNWLAAADPELLHRLHLARGFLASVFAVALTFWFVTRLSPPVSRPRISSRTLEEGARPGASERLGEYTRWLINLRWVAIGLAATLSIYASIASILPVHAQVGVAVTVGILALANVAYTALAGRKRLQGILLAGQAYVDLGVLTAFLHFTGGIENPLGVMMIFYVVVAGMVLPTRQCYMIAAAGTALFASLALGEATGALPHYTFELFPHPPDPDGGHVHAAHSDQYVLARVIIHGTALFFGAYLVTQLTGRIRVDEHQLLRLAERAATRRQVLEQALESTDTALALFDSGGRPMWLNSRWRSWFEPPETAETPPWAPPAAAHEALHDTLRHGRTHTVEASLGQDGASEISIYRITTAPLHDSRGEFQHAVALGQDVTQQKQAQSRMMRAEKLAAAGELAGHIAHEVNNPIGILTAKARILRSDRSSEMSDTVRAEIIKIIELGDRVAQITQGLLSSCRPTDGKRWLLDIRSPIQEALSMLEQRAQKAGVRLEADLSASLPPVRGNARELQQVFVNLLLNALDAMPVGGELHAVATADEGTQGGSGVTITIDDTGIGIRPETRERAFEPFFTTKAHGRGTGLGLSVCAEVVRRYGGDIDIAPRATKGTRVRVTLPSADAASGSDG